MIYNPWKYLLIGKKGRKNSFHYFFKYSSISTSTKTSDGFQRIKPPKNVYDTQSPLVSPNYIASPKTCCIIGAPMTLGQPLLGTDHGPNLLREKGLKSEITSLDWRVSDIGDLEFPKPTASDPVLKSQLGKAKNCYPVGKGNLKIFEAAYKSHQEEMFTLVVGKFKYISVGARWLRIIYEKQYMRVLAFMHFVFI